MGDVLVKAAAFVAVILAGYLMKRGGLFKKEDFHVLSKVVIYITLPSAIISNFSKMTIDYSLLLMCLIGIFCNLVTVAAGYLANIRRSGEYKAFDMLNVSGYNIGNFTMPFVQNFFGPVGFAVTSLFDAGNAVMCTGLTYTAASAAMAKRAEDHDQDHGEAAFFFAALRCLHADDRAFFSAYQPAGGGPLLYGDRGRGQCVRGSVHDGHRV